MTQDNLIKLSQPGAFSDLLTDVLRNGARALLAQAVEAEVAGFLGGHADKLTDDGELRLRARQGSHPCWIITMANHFQIYGPFEIEKLKIVDKKHQNAFWSDCEDDEMHYQLSLAKGLYLFSLRNASNYSPQYVGMTERDFRELYAEVGDGVKG